MDYRSFDPFRQVMTAEFPSDDRVDPGTVFSGFHAWSSFPLEVRMRHFLQLADMLESDLESVARLITEEVGKPLHESSAEVRKSVYAIRYLADRAPEVLCRREVLSEAHLSCVLPEPFGPILAVMPWNFPFWQVFRFSVATMLAGNTVLLKHAPNVPRCALEIEKRFRVAGFPDGAFKNLFLSNDGVHQLIASPLVAGVAFTGSDATGSLIAASAGRHIKKVILELGGNDPMLVFPDADVEAAVVAAVASRCINAGQACNGAKRFLVHASVHDRFVAALIEKVSALRMGDPMDPAVSIGPIARFDLLERLRDKVRATVDQGAVLAFTAEAPAGSAWFHPPVVLTGVLPGMTAFEEELFGPVWSVTSFTSNEEALRLANGSAYGLGASVWTSDEQLIDWMVSRLQTGNVFVNDFVRSDPRFPFGGVKRSGFGKDLGDEGFLEFVNSKTVFRKS